MNTTDKNPEYKKIYQFVKAKLDSTGHFNYGPFDETYYTLRAYESAKDIIRKLNRKVKRQQLLVAAILHDVGKSKLQPSKLFSRKKILGNAGEEWHRHAELGVPIAKALLKKLDHSGEFIEEVCYLIEHHDLRGDKLKQRTLELKILQDADLIADIGFAGFIRPFLFSGKFGQTVIESIQFVLKEDRTKDGELLNLNVSKSLARERMKQQAALAKQMAKEIESDLI
jgi:HD superfamily phosphodiesterase